MTDDNESVTTLVIDHGAVTEAPIWESHIRGKNWAATITGIDPTQPSGLARAFWEKGNGEFLYLVPRDLKVGTPVMFAADYVNTRGRQQRQRWYAYVQAISDEVLTLVPTDTGRHAVEMGSAYAKSAASENDPDVDAFHTLNEAISALVAANHPGSEFETRIAALDDAWKTFVQQMSI